MFLFTYILYNILLYWSFIYSIRMKHTRDLDLSCTKIPGIYGYMDRRIHLDKLKIISYNGDRLIYDERTIETLKNSKLHIKKTALLLDDLNADIIQLAEVADCFILEEIINYMKRNGKYYVPYLFISDDKFTGQNMAILTKIDPSSVSQYTKKIEFTKPPKTNKVLKPVPVRLYKHFIARFNNIIIDNKELVIIGIHLLAWGKPSNDMKAEDYFLNRKLKKEAQANIVAYLVQNEERQCPNRPNKSYVLVMGDFNDLSHQIPDASNQKSSTLVSEIISKNILSGKSNYLMNIAGMKYYIDLEKKNYKYVIEKDQRYTHHIPLHGKKMIDHILVPKNLYNTKILHANIPKYFHVMPKNTRYMTPGDHFPVFAELSIK